MGWHDKFVEGGDWNGAAVWPDDLFGTSPMDWWGMLRYRWEDQLRLVAPDVWTQLETELAPVEKAYRELVAAYREKDASHRELEMRQDRIVADSQRAEGRVTAANKERDEAKARRNELAMQAADLETDRTVLAQALLGVAETLASTKDGTDWADLLTDEVAAIVRDELEASGG